MARLTPTARSRMSKSTFAIPEKAPGPGSYPISDEGHARAALRLEHNASPAEQARIERKVHAKFPNIGSN